MSYSSLDTIQLTQNLYRALHTCRTPSCNRLKLSQYFVKVLAQLCKNMIGIKRKPVSGMDSSCGSANQYSFRQGSLQAGCGRKNLFPVRQVCWCGAPQHSSSRNDSVVHKGLQFAGDISVLFCSAVTGPAELRDAGQPNPASDLGRSHHRSRPGLSAGD